MDQLTLKHVFIFNPNLKSPKKNQVMMKPKMQNYYIIIQKMQKF